jgi:hypothetical protein
MKHNEINLTNKLKQSIEEIELLKENNSNQKKYYEKKMNENKNCIHILNERIVKAEFDRNEISSKNNELMSIVQKLESFNNETNINHKINKVKPLLRNTLLPSTYPNCQSYVLQNQIQQQSDIFDPSSNLILDEKLDSRCVKPNERTPDETFVCNPNNLLHQEYSHQNYFQQQYLRQQNQHHLLLNKKQFVEKSEALRKEPFSRINI